MNDVRYADARHEPLEGNWTNVGGPTSVAGINHRERDFEAFSHAAEIADQSGARYGLELVPDPTNRFDENAIKVVGYVHAPKLFGGTKVKRWHVGFVPAEVARTVSMEFVSKGISIQARMYHIYENDGGFRSIDFVVIVPRDEVPSRY